jgi:flagellar motor switch protein FliM
MLRLLASGFSMVDGKAEARRSEINAAISVMSVVKTLGILLTTLECGKDGMSAGMNFHLPRSSIVQPQAHAGAAMLSERASEIADALAKLEQQLPIDPSLPPRLRKVAQGLVQSS